MYIVDALGRLRNIRKVKSLSTDSSSQSESGADHQADSKDGELLRLKAIFPFDFFPNELIIRKKTVSMIKRGFLTSYTETMLVQDIGLVSVFQTVLFASLKISYKAPSADVIINTIPKQQAVKAKEVLDQLMVIKNDNQETDDVSILSADTPASSDLDIGYAEE